MNLPENMTPLKLLEKSIDSYFALLPRKKPSQLLFTNTNLIAHRGAHDRNKHIIENTTAAFTSALNLGCWGIEFDIHETLDGELVVNHDPTLQRLWGQNKTINDISLKELHAIAPQVPTLLDIVENYGKKMHLFIELKTPFIGEAQLAELLKPLTPCEDYHIISLDEQLFKTFSLFPKNALLLVASHNNVKKFCQISLEMHYGGVLGHYLLMSNSIIKQLRADRKQEIGVGMIDSRFSLYRELSRGIQWLFSDNIHLLNQCLQELKKEQNLHPRQ